MDEESSSPDLYLYEERLKTFKSWPFDENHSCTPDKMATAGFIHYQDENDPDAVQCFICLKTLSGWEPEDDPWLEHERHAPNCAFIKMKQGKELTVDDVLKLDLERIQNKFTKMTKTWIDNFRSYAQETRNIMENEIVN